MDFFDFQKEQVQANEAPLADRMRPRTLDEFVGQQHLTGEGKLLRRMIEADRLSSAIFYGPPGCGKTTLAEIIAQQTAKAFTRLSAVSAGVKDIREAIASASQLLGMQGKQTILFIDEIHRFNKSQQDALLPHVEDGTVILIGATTENPYFEVNGPLLSRSQVFEFQPLEDEDLVPLLKRALADRERGLGGYQTELTGEGQAVLVEYASGDARRLLNALELAVVTTPADEDGLRRITAEVAAESMQRPMLQYDRAGDHHYDVISAFIKSMRGSDPDAAIYWLAEMLAAGEDPRFIARRILVHAAEDVGLADPRALQVAQAAAYALEFVGMPEARIPLAEAVLYIASAPKSNSVITAIDSALSLVRRQGTQAVPDHLRDAHYSGASDLGRGEGYQYPHDYPAHFVHQQYLPASVTEQFYHPSDSGYERKLDAYWQEIKGNAGGPGTHNPDN